VLDSTLLSLVDTAQPRPLRKVRVPPIPRTKPLHKSNNTERGRCRSVVAPIVGSTRSSHHASQDAGNALVIDVVDARLRPLVVENTCNLSISIILETKGLAR
jgi:hypothetical protein